MDGENLTRPYYMKSYRIMAAKGGRICLLQGAGPGTVSSGPSFRHDAH